MSGDSPTLTKGSLPAQLATLSLPLIAGNILQQLYNTTDAWMVGRYAGATEFAAIGVAGSVMNLFLFTLIGLCNGYSALFARTLGAGDPKKFRRRHLSTLVHGFGLTLILTLGGALLLRPLLSIMQTPEELIGQVSIYLFWILGSMPGAFLYNFFAAMLRAAGNTAVTLGVLALSVTANIALDAFFVAFLGYGIQGAAAATAITQMLSAGLCWFFLFHTHRELLLRRETLREGPSEMREAFIFGSAPSLHQVTLYFGKMLVQAAVNSCGTEAIVAFTAATRIESFVNSFGDSNAAATAVLVGQNAGAGNRKRVKQSFICSISCMAGLGAVCAALLALTAPWTIRALLGTGEGIAFVSAVKYLRVISCFYVFCFTGNTYIGYFNGNGQVNVPFVGSTISLVLRVVLAWALILQLGLNGIAVATGVSWLWVNLFWEIFRRRLDRKLP